MKAFLKTISEITKIPIIEGVYRVSLDNFILNAVISELLGVNFIIKKIKNSNFNPNQEILKQ